MDGFLYGQVDPRGTLTGSNITFLYPDLSTGLTGEFADGKLVRGTAVIVAAERCRGGMKEVLTRPYSRYSDLGWESEPRRLNDIGRRPTVSDPFERRSVYVRESSIPGSGDGLFARRPFTAGQLVSYYSGVVRDIDALRDDEDDSYVASFGEYVPGFHDDIVIDVPARYRNLTTFRTTLAHKANTKACGELNGEFDLVDHPFFGAIMGIVATRAISKGEEIFSDYNYELDNAPDWYIQSSKMCK